MKQLIMNKLLNEYNLRTVGGRKLSSYRFEELVGFLTRLKKGEELK